MTEAVPTNDDAEFIARAGTRYRVQRYLFVALMLIMGLFFAYDGFYNWPAQVTRFEHLPPDQQAAATKPHSEFDIRLQKELAIGLLAFAPLLLIFFIYRSRGACRLSQGVLYVPGHPPVPLDNIRALDKAQWDRKGIADVEYEVPQSGKVASLRLDDFVYQHQPIRAIVDRIEAHLAPQPQRDAEAHGPASGI